MAHGVVGGARSPGIVGIRITGCSVTLSGGYSDSVESADFIVSPPARFDAHKFIIIIVIVIIYSHKFF